MNRSESSARHQAVKASASRAGRHSTATASEKIMYTTAYLGTFEWTSRACKMYPLQRRRPVAASARTQGPSRAHVRSTDTTRTRLSSCDVRGDADEHARDDVQSVLGTRRRNGAHSRDAHTTEVPNA